MEGSDRSTGIQVSTRGKGSRSFARVIRRVSVQRFSNRRGEKEEEEEEEKNSLTTGRAIDHSFHKENAFTRTCNHKLYNIRRCNKVDHPPAIHLFLFLPSLLSFSLAFFLFCLPSLLFSVDPPFLVYEQTEVFEEEFEEIREKRAHVNLFSKHAL